MPGRFDLAAVLLGDGLLVLAELAADGLHLLAQEVLALLLVGTRLHVVADALAHLHLGEAVALQAEGQLQPLGHVEGLQQRHLLLVGEVRRVAGGVGQHARLGDRADEGGDAAVVAAQLEHLFDHGAVLALEVAGAAVDRLVVDVLVDLDTQGAGGIGVGGTGHTAVQCGQGDGLDAAGKPDAVGDLGHGPDAAVGVLVARNEQHPLLVADVDGEGDGHVGEDDGVVQGDQQHGGHRGDLHSYLRVVSDDSE